MSPRRSIDTAAEYLAAEATVTDVTAQLEALQAQVTGADLATDTAERGRLAEELRRVENASSALSGRLEGLATVRAALCGSCIDCRACRGTCLSREPMPLEATLSRAAHVQRCGPALCTHAHTEVVPSHAPLSVQYPHRSLCGVQRMADTRQNLAQECYQTVDREFKARKVELETLQMGSRDLERYCKALEKALLQYHSTKMESINQARARSKVYKCTELRPHSLQALPELPDPAPVRCGWAPWPAAGAHVRAAPRAAIEAAQRRACSR